MARLYKKEQPALGSFLNSARSYLALGNSVSTVAVL